MQYAPTKFIFSLSSSENKKTKGIGRALRSSAVEFLGLGMGSLNLFNL